ncbi:MAG: VanW family protein [Clostridiales bacterium]|nr:VanW family protein [Clostridiales bacterium]
MKKNKAKLALFALMICLFCAVTIFAAYASGNNKSGSLLNNTEIASYAYAGNYYDPCAKNYTLLGEFKTEFSPHLKSRNSNIKLAAKALDGTIILPGEELSFNEAVGPTTKENGYQLSRIFIKGKDKKGYGGGVCQVSSTLYNAALKAGMDITERHAHSKDVYYVQEGMDAAVSYGGIDLKFANPHDTPVKISTSVSDSEIYITIAAI